jgi:hypothetical protein
VHGRTINGINRVAPHEETEVRTVILHYEIATTSAVQPLAKVKQPKVGRDVWMW